MSDWGVFVYPENTGIPLILQKAGDLHKAFPPCLFLLPYILLLSAFLRLAAHSKVPESRSFFGFFLHFNFMDPHISEITGFPVKCYDRYFLLFGLFFCGAFPDRFL